MIFLPLGIGFLQLRIDMHAGHRILKSVIRESPRGTPGWWRSSYLEPKRAARQICGIRAGPPVQHLPTIGGDAHETRQIDSRGVRPGLAQLGDADPDIVVVDGDVHNSTRTEHFAKKFPERFFNVGIAESNLVGVAAGLASSGKRAWLASFAAFVMCNAYDQLRMSVAFPCLDVKVVGTHAGISIGEDGPSQMGIEDVGLACSLPNFTVVVPADEPSTFKAVEALGKIQDAGLSARRPAQRADHLRRAAATSSSARRSSCATART